MDKINKMSLEKLSSFYGIINELCSDFSRMTDNYSLATGDSTFQSMPNEIKDMISERQEFFSYREKIKEILKNKVKKIMNDD